VQPYSPERRTALVLCGTGAHGAYHAGVLRALQEAGVKIDVMAGQGAGAAAAALAAIDGGARLWDADGIWRGAGARSMYRWKWPLRAAAWTAATLLTTLAVPFLLFLAGLPSYPIYFVAAALLEVVLIVLAVAIGIAIDARRWPARRKAAGAWWWRMLGAPVDADSARRRVGDALWELIRGGAHMARPGAAALGRRYSDVLAENLGQPGFREVMLVVTDLDARRDVVGALLQEPYRHEFSAPRPGRERRSEAIDLAGAGRDHAFDFVAAGLTPPVGCDAHLMTFAPDTFWRGETHRMCDRPGTVWRLLEELAGAGVSQAVIVSAVATPPPHRLSVPRLEIQHRVGEFLAAAESAALRDALELARLRFDSVYLICPAHNPVGVFDVGGAYDDASDRRQDLVELMERAYEDAYRQFIEPVVGASGEHLARVRSRT
jgi:patatin-like phospholipase